MSAAQSIPCDVDVVHERDRMILRGQAGRATLEFPSRRVVDREEFERAVRDAARADLT